MKNIVIILIIMMTLYGCAYSTSSIKSTSTQSYPAPNQINPMEGYPNLEKTNIGPSETIRNNPILPKGELPPTPDYVPHPEFNMGSLSGTIFSFTTNMIIPDTMFYLTPAIGPEDKDLPPAMIGPLAEYGDIVGRTDEKGQFFLSNVPPGNYFFIVEAPMNWAVALEEGNESPPRMVVIEPGQKHQLGLLFVSWP